MYLKVLSLSTNSCYLQIHVYIKIRSAGFEPLFFRLVYAVSRWLYCYGITKKMFILSLSLCPLVFVPLSFSQRSVPFFFFFYYSLLILFHFFLLIIFFICCIALRDWFSFS